MKFLILLILSFNVVYAQTMTKQLVSNDVIQCDQNNNLVIGGVAINSFFDTSTVTGDQTGDIWLESLSARSIIVGQVNDQVSLQEFFDFSNPTSPSLASGIGLSDILGVANAFEGIDFKTDIHWTYGTNAQFGLKNATLFENSSERGNYAISVLFKNVVPKYHAETITGQKAGESFTYKIVLGNNEQELEQTVSHTDNFQFLKGCIMGNEIPDHHNNRSGYLRLEQVTSQTGHTKRFGTFKWVLKDRKIYMSHIFNNEDLKSLDENNLLDQVEYEGQPASFYANSVFFENESAFEPIDCNTYTPIYYTELGTLTAAYNEEESSLESKIIDLGVTFNSQSGKAEGYKIYVKKPNSDTPEEVLSFLTNEGEITETSFSFDFSNDATTSPATYGEYKFYLLRSNVTDLSSIDKVALKSTSALIPEPSDIFEISAPYPNPTIAGSGINFKFVSEREVRFDLEMNATNGRRVASLSGTSELGENVQVINTNGLSPGMYIIKVHFIDNFSRELIETKIYKHLIQ